MSRLAAAVILLFLAFLPMPAFADPAGAPEQSAVKSVVQGQIDALGRDDGPAAYGYAAPGIRAMFPTPDIFLNMVRQAYAPVYKPSSIAFGEIVSGPSGLAAKVYLTAADGSNWIALYRFEKQADGSWKISGVQLLKDTAPTI